jgi:hypothetical protein
MRKWNRGVQLPSFPHLPFYRDLRGVALPPLGGAAKATGRCRIHIHKLASKLRQYAARLLVSVRKELLPTG